LELRDSPKDVERSADPTVQKILFLFHGAQVRYLGQAARFTNFPALSYEQFSTSRVMWFSLRDSGGVFCTGIALTKHWIILAGLCLSPVFDEAEDLQIRNGDR
jgi:hypothetical protein